MLLPISAAQPQHAARCAATGVGETLDTDTVMAGELRAAPRAVLHRPRYREHARRLPEALAALPERRAREERPIPTT